MNDLDAPPLLKGPLPRPALPSPDRDTDPTAEFACRAGADPGGGCSGSACSYCLSAALGLGVWRHYEQHRQVTATAEQLADFVPSVRVEKVTQRLGRKDVSLPGTTLAFERQIFMRAPAAMWRSAMSTSAITSRPGNSLRRSPPLKSMTRLPNTRTASSRAKRRATRIKPNNRWPRSPGDATRHSSSKAG